MAALTCEAWAMLRPAREAAAFYMHVSATFKAPDASTFQVATTYRAVSLVRHSVEEGIAADRMRKDEIE